MTCPECGATNPKGAEWCNLCARPLGVARSTNPEPAVPAAEEARSEVATDIDDGPVPDDGPASDPAQPTWTCGTCGNPNLIDDDECATCGTSIFEAHGGKKAIEEDRDKAAARAWVPGAGQSALGDSATGGMVVAVTALSFVFGLLLLFGGGAIGGGTAALLIGAATWGAGWFDTQQRLSNGMALLTPGRLLAVAGLVVVIVLFATTGATSG